MRSRWNHATALMAAGLVLVCAGTGFAAGTPKKSDPKAEAAAKAQQDAMMAEMMKYMNPGPMHEFLKPLAGTWKTTMKMYSPAPATSEGTCEATWIMGGRYLMSKHTGSLANMPFEGMEILGYDNRKQEFTSAWVDNMGTAISLSSHGKADPATKTLTMDSMMDDPATGKPIAYRMVTKIIDENTHTFAMTTQKDGKDVTEMEMTYTRVK